MRQRTYTVVTMYRVKLNHPLLFGCVFVIGNA